LSRLVNLVRRADFRGMFDNPGLQGSIILQGGATLKCRFVNCAQYQLEPCHQAGLLFLRERKIDKSTGALPSGLSSFI
jgi:hypothetical protein